MSEDGSDYQQMDSFQVVFVTVLMIFTMMMKPSTQRCCRDEGRGSQESRTKVRHSHSKTSPTGSTRFLGGEFLNIISINCSRTKSDITQSVSKVGRSFTLSRSKSIASARDRWKLSSSYGLLPFLGKEKQEKEEREEKETERLKEALTVEAGQRIRLERELVVARQEGRQQNEELAELREEQREMMGAETRQDYFWHMVSCFIL